MCVFVSIIMCPCNMKKCSFAKIKQKCWPNNFYEKPLGVCWTRLAFLAARPKPPGGFHVRLAMQWWQILSITGASRRWNCGRKGGGGLNSWVINTRILRGIQPAKIKINPINASKHTGMVWVWWCLPCPKHQWSYFLADDWGVQSPKRHRSI